MEEIIKSHTDLGQSKKLSEILSYKTADMYFSKYDTIHAATLYSSCDSEYFKIHEYIPCWSLAALLRVFPDEITDNGDVYRNMFFRLKGKYTIQYPILTTLWPSLLSVEADNPIDACVVMIEKLYEHKII